MSPATQESPIGWYAPPARVMKPQVIVTSYRRPLYLEQCLGSLRQCDIELYAVDGGDRDEETTRVLDNYCDKWLGLTGNPGADVARNAGLKAFVTDPVCVFSSDDYVYPRRWAAELLDQWYSLRGPKSAGASQWGMIACPTEEVIRIHGDSGDRAYQQPDLFSIRKMCLVDQIPGASGVLIDTNLLRRIGGFPVYGRFGHGLAALSIEMSSRNILRGYSDAPVVGHPGVYLYPEHSDRRAAVAGWRTEAAAHRPGERCGNIWPGDLPGDAL
jgi:glycosyltransferase involved in cell wall biosynthesis